MRALVVITVAAVLGACSRQDETAATPAANANDAAPAEAAPAVLTPEQQAALVRAHSPVLGNPDAPVTVVEFLDPACSACRAYAPLVKQIQFLYPREVRVVVRFAAFHEGSDEAIRLLYAAGRQGKFEAVLMALFDGQDDWAAHGAPNLGRAWQLAAAAGMDIGRGRQDAQTAAATDLLRLDGGDIETLKVDRTPTFFVNGRALPQFGPEELMDLVKQEVGKLAPAQAAAPAATP